MSDVTRDARDEVIDRARGACEARSTRSCTGRGIHIHHRKLRRHGDHRPINLLLVCIECHTHIHLHVAESYDHGWLVKSTADPAAVPVR